MFYLTAFCKNSCIVTNWLHSQWEDLPPLNRKNKCCHVTFPTLSLGSFAAVRDVPHMCETIISCLNKHYFPCSHKLACLPLCSPWQPLDVTACRGFVCFSSSLEFAPNVFHRPLFTPQLLCGFQTKMASVNGLQTDVVLSSGTDK